MSQETLGDRMKSYEALEANRKAMNTLPTICRLDGRAFHTFCRGMTKPFDINFIGLMNEVTAFLVDQLNATIGYVQSDEITLAFPIESILFDGRYQKINSIAAGLASSKFNQLLPQYFSNKADKLQVFDARCWQVPSKQEACNAFLWRENDATKNSISMLAQSKFSHSELQNKNTSQMHEMLFQKFNINWNDLPARLKRGSYFRKESIQTPVSEELAKTLTENNLSVPEFVIRSRVVEVDMPPFGTVVNKVEVVFDKAVPIVATSVE